MHNRIFRFILAAGIVCSMLWTLPAQSALAAGANRYVATTGVNSGTCTNPATPCLTIAYAIAHSGLASTDLIHIAAGTYHEYLTIDRPVSLLGVQENLTLIDGGVGAAPQGGGGLPVINVNLGVTVILRDLNVQNGIHLGGDGGGINNSGTLSLVHVVVSGNKAISGGGISNSGKLNLSDVFISGNTATNGGYGGGLYTSASNVYLTDVTFSGNTASTLPGATGAAGAPGGGGGIGVGGGIADVAGNLRLNNVTFSGNTAHLGGAIVEYNGSMSITNSTIVNNHKDAVAGSSTGGILDRGAINMVNTILYGNDEANCSIVTGTLTSLGHNIDGGATCLTPAIAQASDQPNTNPLLIPLAKNGGYVPTLALRLGSPAIDAAAPASCPTRDAASWPRPQDGNGDGSAVCDIGAFEAPTYALFTSTAANDGWVLESSETSGVGGALNSAAATFNVGDNAARKQFRGMLSFNTASLPDTAITIKSAMLKIKKRGTVGSISPATFRGLLADMRKPYFGRVVGLEAGDFQATASKLGAAIFHAAALPGWYNASILSTAFPYINQAGATQFRIRFGLDDNNNAVADYMLFYSGSAPVGSRPQLAIQYYKP